MILNWLVPHTPSCWGYHSTHKYYVSFSCIYENIWFKQTYLISDYQDTYVKGTNSEAWWEPLTMDIEEIFTQDEITIPTQTISMSDYDGSWLLLEFLTMVHIAVYAFVCQARSVKTRNGIIFGSFCTVLCIHSYVKHPLAIFFRIIFSDNLNPAMSACT